MLKQEQRELAEYLKYVHLSLRRKAQEMGAEKAWKDHLQNTQVLQNYAYVMKKLAEEFWNVNNKTDGHNLLCRIEWMINSIVEYFEQDLCVREIGKEKKKLELLNKKEVSDEVYFQYLNLKHPPFLKVLDVGSCYNPFGRFEFLETYPIDLYPAIPEVKKCNFLDLKITKNPKTGWFQNNLTEIPSNFFDVVIFSLFLEYLPCPKQRYIAVSIAYEVLKTNGILLIATPDSKHASANAKIMKSWKIGAADIGFSRIKLEKLKYLYCMVFRKSIVKNYALFVSNIKKENIKAEKMFIIPQDSVDYNFKEKKIEKKKTEEAEVRDLFAELPL